VAIYSTIFVADETSLVGGFAGWKPPLAVPVKRTMVNPFTGESMEVETEEPTWETTAEPTDPYRAIITHVVESYDEYLEGRISDFVRSCPHWCSKNLTSIEIAPLVREAIGGGPLLQVAMYAPPEIVAGLERFPTAFIECLNSCTPACLQSLASRWAASISTPDYTHTIGGVRIKDDWDAASALSLLEPIAGLARRAISGQTMFLLTEA
jgi:hypothetical protein